MQTFCVELTRPWKHWNVTSLKNDDISRQHQICIYIYKKKRNMCLDTSLCISTTKRTISISETLVSKKEKYVPRYFSLYINYKEKYVEMLCWSVNLQVGFLCSIFFCRLPFQNISVIMLISHFHEKREVDMSPHFFHIIYIMHKSRPDHVRQSKQQL
jgi:hypothetical protein